MVVATAAISSAVPRGEDGVDRYHTLDTFAQALAYIANDYVEPLDERSLIYGAVDGMVARLDEHSAFLPPRKYERLRQDTDGEFAGVGLSLAAGNGNGAPIIEEIAPASPAARAGLRAGDHVIAIDGRVIDAQRRAKTLHSALRGPLGSRVELLVSRPRWQKPRTFTLVRERIKVPSVQHEVLADGVGYIALRRFQEASSADVVAALRELRAQHGLRALILDLRGNPGGLLEQAVRVADLFIDSGTIVTIKGRQRRRIEVQNAHAGGTWQGFPMVVMIDAGSASAAEIVAGALQDHRRAMVLGEPSYGKGSVQTFLDLRDGSGLKLTTARYFTPSGKSLEGAGIQPDLAVEAFAAETIVVKRRGHGSAAPKEGRATAGEVGEKDAKLLALLQRDHQLSVAYQTAHRWLEAAN